MVENKSQKDKPIFHVSKIPYKTQDMEWNKTQEKNSVEQFYHIMHMNVVTGSRLCSQHNDCSLQIHDSVSNTIDGNYQAITLFLPW